MRPTLSLAALAAILLTALPAPASEPAAAKSGGAGGTCTGFGPQTPRDIDRKNGENPRAFAFAPAASAMNLCNIHFHKSAEHKAAAYAVPTAGSDGHAGGYACAMAGSLSAAEQAPVDGPVCAGAHGGLRPGDTIEVHWVFTTCDVAPGPTLGACLSPACANPQLRVEAQVFTLVNDRAAADFAAYGVGGPRQPKALPTGTGKPVQFLGSTTGPSFDDKKCSPFQVTWNVRPDCAKLDITSIAAFCKGNPFKEDHAHGVRALVTDPKLLSRIE